MAARHSLAFCRALHEETRWPRSSTGRWRAAVTVERVAATTRPLDVCQVVAAETAAWKGRGPSQQIISPAG